jgi:hypothetical protein
MRFPFPRLPAALFLVVQGSTLLAGPWTVTLRDFAAIEPAAVLDQHGAGFSLGGLSGIAYLGGSSYAAVMDQSGKVVRLEASIAGDGTILSVAAVGGTSLSNVRDFEGIALADPGAGRAWLAEENSPGVHEYDLASGQWLRTLATPGVFANRRASYGFESLALSADGMHLWTANEDALTLDGPLSTTSAGGVVRLLRYDAGGGSFDPAAQFAYRLEPLHGGPVFHFGNRNGLVELVALPDGTLLALERSFAWGLVDGGLRIFHTSIFAIDFDFATDVSTLGGGLAGQSYAAVGKELLWRGAVGSAGMNLEGLTLGPQLGPNRWALVGVVDDGDPTSTSTLVVFEISRLPEPTSILLAGLGAAAALGAAQRRRNRGARGERQTRTGEEG